jgi:flavin-binding protein dodecin
MIYILDKMNKNKKFDRRCEMGNVYKIIEIVGTSQKSWEDAARVALETASKSVEEIRIAEVNKLDVKVEKDATLTFRAKLDISFKYKK